MILWAILISWVLAEVPSSGQLRIVVMGIKEQKGEIGYRIFSTEEGFPGKGNKTSLNGFVKVEGNSAEIPVPNLPFGIYAVSVFHDLNSDHELNKNFLGIPSEPVGASNNPKGRLGPPIFEECRFEFKVANQETKIYLVD